MSQLGRAWDFASEINKNMMIRDIFKAKEIPRDYSGDIVENIDEMEDCLIFRLVPSYIFGRKLQFEYLPVKMAVSEQEMFDRAISSYLDLSNNLTAEYLDVVIKDHKIVEVRWQGHCEATDTKENNDIITYDDAYIIFTNKVMRQDLFDTENPKYFDIVITEIRLGLAKVEDEMVPCYAFIGTCETIQGKDERILYDRTDIACFMLINALDGTLITFEE